jgi:hypothetical protein
MPFVSIGQSRFVVAWQAMNVHPIAADIHAGDRSLCYRLQILLLLIHGPTWPHATVRDDEEKRCWLASKRGQTPKAQTPYTAPSAASANVADGGQHSKAEIQKAQGLFLQDDQQRMEAARAATDGIAKGQWSWLSGPP